MIRFVLVLFSVVGLAQCWSPGHVGSPRSRHDQNNKLLSVVRRAGHDANVPGNEWEQDSEEDFYRLNGKFKRKADLFIVRSTATPTSLSKFQSLMGTLYGVAGLAHFADLLLGESTLLAQAGAPPFQELDPLGQAYALLWCASGPIAFLASRAGDDEDEALDFADAGLIFYGAVEVGGALLLKQAGFDSDLAVTNAVLVQVLVGVSWLYSSRKIE